ncbi:MAG: CapA family protein [Patescibacteria group bacterium]
MSKKIKILAETLVIILISILLIFGFLQIAQAPLKETIDTFIFQKIQEKNSDNHLPAIEKKPTEFIFGGDVMLSRQVNSRMTKYQNYSWPFAKIKDFLRTADLTIINLESPFAVASDYFVPTGSFSFKADPKAISGLLESGIDIVSLANNHTLNQGKKGLTDTFEILNENNIKYIGAGNNDNEAHLGEIVEINGNKFGFLAYAYPDDYSIANEKSAGIAGMEIEKMREDVQRISEEGAIAIVIIHAGIEYVTEPNGQQINFAHAAIDAGAEAVIGHHPHWPQTFEFYQNKPIIYSLGNLIFDQMWSEETRQGLLAKMSWQDGWQNIELIPIKIHDYGQAEIITDEVEKKSILKKIDAPEDGKILKND